MDGHPTWFRPWAAFSYLTYVNGQRNQQLLCRQSWLHAATGSPGPLGWFTSRRLQSFRCSTAPPRGHAPERQDVVSLFPLVSPAILSGCAVHVLGYKLGGLS